MLSRRAHGHAESSSGGTVTSSSLRGPLANVKPNTKPASRFSFDQLFRRMRTKSGGGDDDETTMQDPTGRQRRDTAAVDSDARHKFHKTSATIKPTHRPPPIVAVSVAAPSPSLSPSSSSNVRLCQSPGGRANVTLAIPVSPSSSKSSSSASQQHSRSRSSSLQVGGRSSTMQLRLYDHDSDECDTSIEQPRSSFSLGSWRDSVVAVLTSNDDGDKTAEETTAVDATCAGSLVFGPTTTTTTTAVVAVVAATVESPPLHLVPVLTRDLVPDVRTLCCLSSSSSSSSFSASLRAAHQYMSHLLRSYLFEIRATKWAAYFLLLIRRARAKRTISSADALSVRFAVCAYVRREAETRTRLKRTQEKLFQRKMTEYRVAMQCICGTSVVKYGRKGKPHTTHLMIENGDTFKWTSAKLLSSKKHIAKKSILLGDIVAVRAGPTTDVLAKALQKGTLRLQDAKCTLSLITRKRTFDIKARSTAEREWLLKSFTFLVELAKEHEKQVAQQVELAIMKKMETLAVWKHGRRGRPHKTRLFINRFGELSWQGRSGDTIQLEEIVAIEPGHATHVFQRSRSAGLTTPRAASRCFSLVTKTRSLDIETSNEQQRDWYVVAFQYLMDKVHEKTAAIKREKAEKQLKMLQELCGAGAAGDGEPGNVGISMAMAPHA